jgi:hypothetical protein
VSICDSEIISDFFHQCFHFELLNTNVRYLHFVLRLDAFQEAKKRALQVRESSLQLLTSTVPNDE